MWFVKMQQEEVGLVHPCVQHLQHHLRQGRWMGFQDVRAAGATRSGTRSFQVPDG